MKRVLVLKGGGARGLSQLKFLSKVEEDTGKPIYELFDLIVGTSVGAINAAVLASGITATDFYPYFKESLPKIFKKKWWNVFSLIQPKYDRKNFEQVWASMFSMHRKMHEVKTDLLITAVDRVEDVNHYIGSWEGNKYNDMDMVYAVTASFAAPYFFGQMVDEDRQVIWFDGGVGLANMPLDKAYAEIVSRGWLENDEVEVVAVGTGLDKKRSREYIFNELKCDSLFGQLYDYISPIEGGMARKQALRDQVQRYNMISNSSSNFNIKYIDAYTYGDFDDISKDVLRSHERAGDAMFRLSKIKNHQWY